MKQNDRKASSVFREDLDPELDAENAEFDFSKAPRPGRNELYELAQGHFHEVPDAEGRRAIAVRRQGSGRGGGRLGPVE